MADNNQVGNKEKTSLDKYDEARDKVKNFRASRHQNASQVDVDKEITQLKREHVEKIRKAIEAEVLSKKSLNLDNSPFVKAVRSVFVNGKNSHDILALDAYNLMLAVIRETADAISSGDYKCLFESSSTTKDDYVKAEVTYLEDYFRGKMLKAQKTSKNKKTSSNKQKAKQQPPATLTQPPHPPTRPQPTRTQTPSAPKASDAVMSADELEKGWKELYDWQEDILGKIQSLQSGYVVGNAPEWVMTLPDKIVEAFVLRFSLQYVKLWNAIRANYEWHRKRASELQNQDYQTAVQNYLDYLRLIEYALSSFGVKAFETRCGQPFDEHRQESVGDSAFSNPVVADSLRKGFEYTNRSTKQRIPIQRELVRVKNGDSSNEGRPR